MLLAEESSPIHKSTPGESDPNLEEKLAKLDDQIYYCSRVTKHKFTVHFSISGKFG
jgi:hypothetical protein